VPVLQYLSECSLANELHLLLAKGGPLGATMHLSGKGEVLLNFEGRIAYANTYFSDLVGIDYTRVAGMSFFDLVFPEDLEKTKELLELNKNSQAQPFRFRLRAVDGTEVWANVQLASAQTPSDVLWGLRAMVTAAEPATAKETVDAASDSSPIEATGSE